MEHLGLGYGYDLDYDVADNQTSLVYLCVGDMDNRVLISHTNRLSRQPSVLAAIDDFGQWAKPIDLWMVVEKRGAITETTPPVKFLTHVKPYYGPLTLNGFGNDNPPMTYAGNGFGRLFSQQINGRYYFKYAGKLETDPTRRGLDCTTFPIVLLELSVGSGPTGKDVADAADATACDLEELTPAELEQHFKANDIPNGIYIVFGTWGTEGAGHVLLYDSDINWLFEFNLGGDRGYRDGPAGQRGFQHTAGAKWWVRKLDEKYRPKFR
jgi:hypothetical protein